MGYREPGLSVEWHILTTGETGDGTPTVTPVRSSS